MPRDGASETSQNTNNNSRSLHSDYGKKYLLILIFPTSYILSRSHAEVNGVEFVTFAPN